MKPIQETGMRLTNWIKYTKNKCRDRFKTNRR